MSKKIKFFFEQITSQKEIKPEQKAVKLYNDLVFHRFNEVLSNANPVFYENIDKNDFESLVREFIKTGAKTPFIWQIPNEFRKFIKKTKIKNMPFAKDLLWFEWIELKLFMEDYSDFTYSKFKWKNRYKVSKSAKIKKLNYKVHLQQFDKKEDTILLVFYHIALFEVAYKEISPLLYEYLKLLEIFTAKKALSKISKKYKIKKTKLQDIFKDALAELCNLGILIKEEKNDKKNK